MSGIPVVVSTNGFGLCVRNVTSGAPLMTVATSGWGIPIVISTTRGIPFVVQGAGGAAPTLGALTLSGSLTNTVSSSGTISGATALSTITSNVTGLTVNSGARTYTWDGTGAAGTTSNGLVEALAGATGSPKNNSVTVAAAVTAPVITQTSSAGANPLAWSTVYGSINPDLDYVTARWRIDGGSWTNEALRLFTTADYWDSQDGALSWNWPLITAATLPAGALIEAQEAVVASTPRNILFIGDSWVGSGFMVQYQTAHPLLAITRDSAAGSGTQGLTGVLARLPDQLDALRPRIVHISNWRNDLDNDTLYPTVADWWADMLLAAQMVKTADPTTKVSMETVIRLEDSARTVQHGRVSAANTLMLAAVGGGLLDAVVDFAADATLGAVGAMTPGVGATAISTDGLHMNGDATVNNGNGNYRAYQVAAPVWDALVTATPVVETYYWSNTISDTMAAAVAYTPLSNQTLDFGFGGGPQTMAPITVVPGDKIQINLCIYFNGAQTLTSVASVAAGGVGAMTFTQIGVNSSGDPGTAGYTATAYWGIVPAGVTSIAPTISVSGSTYTMDIIVGKISGQGVTNAALGPAASYFERRQAGATDPHDIDGGLAAAANGLLTLCFSATNGATVSLTGATAATSYVGTTAGWRNVLGKQTAAANVTVPGQGSGGPGFSDLLIGNVKWSP